MFATISPLCEPFFGITFQYAYTDNEERFLHKACIRARACECACVHVCACVGPCLSLSFSMQTHVTQKNGFTDTYTDTFIQFIHTRFSMLGFVARAFVYPCAAPHYIVPESLRVIPSVRWWWWCFVWFVCSFKPPVEISRTDEFSACIERERPFNRETRFNSVTHCIFATWQIGTLGIWDTVFWNASLSLSWCLSLIRAMLHVNGIHTDFDIYMRSNSIVMAGWFFVHRVSHSLSPLSLLIFVVVASFKSLECHIAPILCVIYLIFRARNFFVSFFDSLDTRDFILSSWKNVKIIRNFLAGQQSSKIIWSAEQQQTSSKTQSMFINCPIK